MLCNRDITYFAKVNYRNRSQRFGIKQYDRLLHTYIIGKTGTGKSTLLETMVMQDIEHKRGICLLDPHGDLAESIVNKIPKSRRKDVVYFNVPDVALNLKYNPFRKVSYEKRALVASSILDAMKKLWFDAWGVKLEHVLRNAILTLLDQPTATINDIPKLLLDKTFRYNAVANVENESLKLFWKKEFPQYNKFDLLPALNKVGAMLSYPVVKRILVENTNEVSLRKAMDDKKIVLVNLSKGHIGADASQVLGALFVSSLSSAAFSRVDIPEEERKPFMLYLDEFHNFSTLSLVNMFAELRKFRVGLTLAHQYMQQLDEKIRKAIIGNIGTLISFRVGSDDATFLSREFYPHFSIEDLISLPNYHVYLKLMIDSVPSKPFSAICLNSYKQSPDSKGCTTSFAD